MTDSPTDGTIRLLEGIKVVEFAQNLAIPMCGRILAGMGADVVKVEPPTGDAMRSGGDFGPMEAKAFALINPDKRSLALDLTSPEAAPVIEGLFRWADVVLVAFKQRDLARYGIDWDHARAINPRLVHLTHTPFGPEGPDANEGGYDVLVQALSGMGFTMNRSEGGVPLATRPAVNDSGTGLAGALGVVAALRHRDQTGVGQRVDVSLLATALNLSLPTVSQFTKDQPVGSYSASQAALIAERDAGRGFDELRHDFETNLMAGQRNFRLYFRHYGTSDGLLTVAGLSRGLRAKFHEATGITRPAGSLKLADQEFQDIIEEAETLFASDTTDHWMEVLRCVGYPCGRYNLPFEALNDPQVRANWFVDDFEHPVAGAYTTPGMPLQFSETPVGFSEPSPLFAADTTDVLDEIGMSAAQIKTLIAGKTVIARQ
ncbi:MAG: CoA:oxalate CoA-transferase [Acidimicrobiales bacterium]|jgi:CoA:oxalate CoA-transferase